MPPKLISPAYAKLNRDLHDDVPEYGTSGSENIEVIFRYVNHYKPRTILDYGCGKGNFKKAMLPKAPLVQVLEYDPAIPGKEKCPAGADMVVCGDVLEHIEPELLDNVLGHIKSVANYFCILTISHVPAQKTLADGRNAHLIIEPYEWWQRQLEKHFFNIQRIAHGADPETGTETHSLVFATSKPFTNAGG